MKQILRVFAAGLLAGSCAQVAAAQSFAGKTINMLVGYTAGGGYDIYTRLMAQYLPKFISGHPSVDVQNMPGAGSTKLASYIYNVAPADGTYIGAVAPEALTAPVLNPTAPVHFDATHFAYLGSADVLTMVCVTTRRSKVATFEDAMKTPTIIGAIGPGGSSFEYGWLLKKTTGAKFDIVPGYPGTSDIALAMDRGEVDGICGVDWSALKGLRPDWIRDNKVNVLVQVGPVPNPELAKRGVPEVGKYLKTDRDNQIVDLINAQQVFGRPYILPPRTPAGAVDALRTAFMQLLTDPSFRRDAKKLGLSVNPADAPTVQSALQKIYGAPAELIEAARQSIVP